MVRYWVICATERRVCDASGGSELASKPKGVETILMGDLNTRLVEPREKHEEELETELADHGLEDVTRYFAPRQQYRGRGKWTWHMHREGRKVTGRGDYVLSTAWG